MDWFSKITWTLGWDLLNLAIIVENSPFWRIGRLVPLSYHILFGVLESLAYRQFRLIKAIKMGVELILDC